MIAAVEARELFRIYETEEGSAAALQGLSFDVREREVVVVIGPSGSGKSTLLRILAALDRPSAGSVRAFSQDLARLERGQRARYRSDVIGYADQHYNRALAPELTAREIVALRPALAGTERADRSDRADELLERVGLRERAEARPYELSGGEQQRLAVCAALAHRPRLLLADEPTGELDAENAAVVYRLIADLVRADGCTAVIVSHDLQSTAIADRVLQIRDGRLSGETARATPGAEELVVGRGGWLRLPEEFLRRSGIDSRAVAELDAGRIVVTAPDGEAEAAAEPEAPPSPAPTRAVGPPAVTLRRLTKSYGRGRLARHVLRGLDADIPAGQLTVVTGPSGSGKTTLLHLLAALDRPDAGAIEVLGVELPLLDRAGAAALRRERIAFVAQETELVPFLTARENVDLALAARGRPAAERGEAADNALAALRLEAVAGQHVSRLSTGERQRVALARAVAARAELVLADEPTARLDHANALAVGELLSGLARERGTTVVCATHDPAVVEQADAELALGEPLLEGALRGS